MSQKEYAVTGTWDFKWPQGTKIRVAFQELPAEHQGLFADLCGEFRRFSSEWTGANICFDFGEGRTLPPPERAPKGDMYLARSALPPDHEPLTYDILVSFIPLPVLLRSLDGTREDTVITGQVSVLGSYARRAVYGVPTTLVGPNLNFLGEKGLKGYFTSPDYKEIVLHELGHILGLAHEHQNPIFRRVLEQQGRLLPGQSLQEPVLRFKDLQTMRTHVFDPLSRKLRTQFVADPKRLEEEVNEEIRGEWPHVPSQERDRIPYSDWRTYTAQAVGETLENQTVMAHPGWTHLLAGKPALDIDRKALLQPTSQDLAALYAMYPKRQR